MHVILIYVFMSLYVYKDVLDNGSGSISHTFGVLVSGCTHMYTCKLHLRVYQTFIHVYVDISHDGCR